ncbi:sulfatase-like hydrolase/transferase [Isosphaeraceae bacterium EP7]
MLGSCVSLAFALLAGVAPAEAGRPNIVVVMSDDMGYSDLGCYGGEIGTPNLDALASGGVRFTQFYNNARCCPTRASLLTGLYPHQAGIGHMTIDRGFDGYRGTLNRQSATIAQVLRPAGYRTYMAGKWHVTRGVGQNADRADWPIKRGFDKFYGTIAGAGSYYDPTSLCRQETLITPENDPDYAPDAYYYTDAISDNAVRYLKDHRQESPDKPFFLYVAYTAAHWPMQAPEKAIEKQRGKYEAGYAQARAARLRRMKALGLVPPETDLSPGAESWDEVGDKAWEARGMEVYAAMVDTMDAGVGRIVAQLKESGQLDNTLILFLQDNGGCAELTGRKDNGNAPEALKPLGRDGLQTRVSPPMQTRDGRWVKTGPKVLPGPAEAYIAYGRGWANVSNTPFREYKHWTHEGGISTPLIAHWPAGIKGERAGKLETQPGHLIDLMATCVDLSGAAYPTKIDGQPIKPPEGVSLRPAFDGKPLARTSPIFWEHEGNRAVRDGRWKLVAKADAPWELYDIDVDRTESTDLATSHPDLAKKLAAQWDAYAARANVLPLGAWRAPDDATASLSTERRFDLKAGARLGRANAPAVAGRAFAVGAKFATTPESGDGVLIAQGANSHGYALYLKDGTPRFVVRTPAGSFEIAGNPLPAGPHDARARVDDQGTLSLEVDGKPAASPVPGKLLARMPADGLEVGLDAGGPVGPYESPYSYAGTIESVVIEIAPK